MLYHNKNLNKFRLINACKCKLKNVAQLYCSGCYLKIRKGLRK